MHPKNLRRGLFVNCRCLFFPASAYWPVWPGQSIDLLSIVDVKEVCLQQSCCGRHRCERHEFQHLCGTYLPNIESIPTKRETVAQRPVLGRRYEPRRRDSLRLSPNWSPAGCLDAPKWPNIGLNMAQDAPKSTSNGKSFLLELKTSASKCPNINSQHFSFVFGIFVAQHGPNMGHRFGHPNRKKPLVFNTRQPDFRRELLRTCKGCTGPKKNCKKPLSF